jgi:hypothetical protein
MRYRKALLNATRAAQDAARVGAAARQAAANPKVQAEARLAAARFAVAARRVRKVGVANASRDKQVVAELRRARHHAERALFAARHPRPRRHLVRTTMLLTGAGGAAYAGWRVYGRGGNDVGMYGTTAPISTAPSSTVTDPGVSAPPEDGPAHEADAPEGNHE